MTRVNISVKLCPTRHTYVSEARAWVHVDACLPVCPRAPAAIVAHVTKGSRSRDGNYLEANSQLNETI